MPRESEFHTRSDVDDDHATDDDEEYYVEEEVPNAQLRKYEQNGQLKFNSRLNFNSDLASSVDGGTLGAGLISHRQSTANPQGLP